MEEGKGGKGKKGKNGDSKGQITIKFAGNCGVCGELGHKQRYCWHNTSEKPEAKAAAKTVKCEYCGLKGHKRSECYKLKAKQAAKSTSSPTTPEGDPMAKKRERDTAALERQLAELKLEEFSSSSTAIENIGLSAVEVVSQSPCAGVTAAEMGLAEKPKLISVCINQLRCRDNRLVSGACT